MKHNHLMINIKHDTEKHHAAYLPEKQMTENVAFNTIPDMILTFLDSATVSEEGKWSNHTAL